MPAALVLFQVNNNCYLEEKVRPSTGSHRTDKASLHIIYRNKDKSLSYALLEHMNVLEGVLLLESTSLSHNRESLRKSNSHSGSLVHFTFYMVNH